MSFCKAGYEAYVGLYTPPVVASSQGPFQCPSPMDIWKSRAHAVSIESWHEALRGQVSLLGASYIIKRPYWEPQIRNPNIIVGT